MNFLVPFHFLSSALIALILYQWKGHPEMLGFSVGSAISLGNIIVLHFAWKRILAKKLVALSAGVIVIKYATIGFIIYHIASRNSFRIEWVCFGLGMIVLSALATAFYVSWAEDSRTEKA